MLLHVTLSPQNQFGVSILNGVLNESTGKNKAYWNQDHLSFLSAAQKEASSCHRSAQVCPKDFPHIFQAGKENMNVVLRNFLTYVPRVIVREKITSV